MALDNHVNLLGRFSEGVLESVIGSVIGSVVESVPRLLCKNRKIGRDTAVYRADIICCAGLRGQTMCAVSLMLMAEARPMLQALP